MVADAASSSDEEAFPAAPDGPEPWMAVRLSPRRAGFVVLVLGLEVTALVLTGGSTSALVPLLMLPPLLGALSFRSEAEARLWFTGTFIALAIAAAYELTQPPRPIPTAALGVTTTIAVGLGYWGARHLRDGLFAARRRAHRANEEAVAAVAELHRYQLETAATFAHELKNPLFAMQGLATLLRRRGAREPELAEELDALVADVHGMTTAVTELLDFSRAIHPESLRRVPLRACLEAQCAALGIEGQSLAIAPDLVLVAEPRKLERILRALARPGRLGCLHAQASLDGERVRLDLAVAVELSAPDDGLELATALAAQQGGELLVRRAPTFLATLFMPRHLGSL
ncbi:MAG: histidine kinase dimerization/phospho-acceptor domain-containing protein [Myxococcota bacterium]